MKKPPALNERRGQFCSAEAAKAAPWVVAAIRLALFFADPGNHQGHNAASAKGYRPPFPYAALADNVHRAVGGQAGLRGMGKQRREQARQEQTAQDNAAFHCVTPLSK